MEPLEAAQMMILVGVMSEGGSSVVLFDIVLLAKLLEREQIIKYRKMSKPSF